jgi:hypothetical protein
METSLTVEYDKTGDILYLEKTKCYPEQESEELGYGSSLVSIRRRMNWRTLRYCSSRLNCRSPRSFGCPKLDKHAQALSYDELN